MNIKSSPSHLTLQSSQNPYELAYQAYTNRGLRVELYRLAGGEIRDSLQHLVTMALNADARQPADLPEYEVQCVDQHSGLREVWHVTGVRSLTGWFTPNDEKIYSLHRELTPPDSAAGPRFASGELSLTHQYQELVIRGLGSFSLCAEPLVAIAAA